VLNGKRRQRVAVRRARGGRKEIECGHQARYRATRHRARTGRATRGNPKTEGLNQLEKEGVVINS